MVASHVRNSERSALTSRESERKQGDVCIQTLERTRKLHGSTLCGSSESRKSIDVIRRDQIKRIQGLNHIRIADRLNLAKELVPPARVV